VTNTPAYYGTGLITAVKYFYDTDTSPASDDNLDVYFFILLQNKRAYLFYQSGGTPKNKEIWGYIYLFLCKVVLMNGGMLFLTTKQPSFFQKG
jgi:hypothetical protein